MLILTITRAVGSIPKVSQDRDRVCERDSVMPPSIRDDEHLSRLENNRDLSRLRHQLIKRHLAKGANSKREVSIPNSRHLCIQGVFLQIWTERVNA